MSRYFSFFICSVLAGCSQSSPSGPIVLGHLNPASSAEEMQGIALAVDQINGDAQNHVLGRKVKVIHAELGTSPEEAQGQSVRLLTVDKVEGLLGASRWNQADKMAQAAQSPPIAAMGFTGFAGTPPHSTFFPVAASPTDRGRALARYLKDTLKGSAAIVIKEADAVIAGMVARSFVEQIGSCSEHTAAASDPLDFLKDHEHVKPDCILLCCSAKTALAWRAKLPAVTLFFAGDEAEIAVLQSASELVKPIVAAVSFHAMDDTATTKEFVSQFRAKYGKEPGLASAVAYDAVRLWAEAVRRGKSLSCEHVREQFMKPDAMFEVVGGSFSYGPRQAPKRAIFVVEFSPNGSRLIARYEP